MFRVIPYIMMTIALLFVQIFVLDEISIALVLRPMIFPLVVLLLPIEWRTVWVLLVALATGVLMDVSLGGAGLYTATLLPIAVMRRWVLYLTTHRSVESGDQTSLFSRMSQQQVMIWVATMLAIHHVMFFALETLSFAKPLHLIATMLLSTLLSALIATPIVQIYCSKIVAK